MSETLVVRDVIQDRSGQDRTELLIKLRVERVDAVDYCCKRPEA